MPTQVEVDGTKDRSGNESDRLFMDLCSKLMLQDSTSNPKQGKAGNNRSAQ